jgi:hypothetical protein
MFNAPDLRTTFPRAGREKLGGYVFLGRIIDKVRAMQAGTEGEYVGYCPMSLAFLQETAVSQEAFDAQIRSGADDSAIIAFFDRHVTEQRRAASNEHMLSRFADHLDEQDAEEGVVTT